MSRAQFGELESFLTEPLYEFLDKIQIHSDVQFHDLISGYNSMQKQFRKFDVGDIVLGNLASCGIFSLRVLTVARQKYPTFISAMLSSHSARVEQAVQSDNRPHTPTEEKMSQNWKPTLFSDPAFIQAIQAASNVLVRKEFETRGIANRDELDKSGVFDVNAMREALPQPDEKAAFDGMVTTLAEARASLWSLNDDDNNSSGLNSQSMDGGWQTSLQQSMHDQAVAEKDREDMRKWTDYAHHQITQSNTMLDRQSGMLRDHSRSMSETMNGYTDSMKELQLTMRRHSETMQRQSEALQFQSQALREHASLGANLLERIDSRKMERLNRAELWRRANEERLQAIEEAVWTKTPPRR